MQIYLVGGAVRDRLLKIEHYEEAERDWVVVGGTVQQMLDLGHQRVGSDFPVFLHPETHEEYALARTERKKGHGYTGFEWDSEPHVTLEQDLLRRDLTINAIACDEQGRLIDPYGGQRDLEQRVLRHVSDAFAEDPLRVLRVARFAARFHSLGFTIADETLALMRQLAESDELAHLVAERVWQETRRALMTGSPEVYIEVLRSCGALAILFPELDCLFGIPQTVKYHPEIDTGTHILLCLAQCARQNASAVVRVAVLLHDLGKGLTPQATLPSHVGHERSGLRLVRGIAERLRLSRAERELAELVCLHHLRCHQAIEMRPDTLTRFLHELDAWRKPDRFGEFLTACEIDVRGRAGRQNTVYASRELMENVRQLAVGVTIDESERAGLDGREIAELIHARRIDRIAGYLASRSTPQHDP